MRRYRDVQKDTQALQSEVTTLQKRNLNIRLILKKVDRNELRAKLSPEMFTNFIRLID